MQKKPSSPAAPRKKTDRKTLAKKIFASPAIGTKAITPQPGASAAIAPDVIARRAHELFLQQGAQHGRDLDHWLAAERELLDATTA